MGRGPDEGELMQIEMAGRSVGDGEPCLVVAEIGENHMMDPEVACALIQQAALASVDAVKFQTARPEELYNPSDPDIEECAAAELDLAYYPRLLEAARANNVIFFSTPFDERSADFLDGLNVPFFKIGSGELTHHALLRHVARKGKPMVVSTGMAGLDWIKAAIRVIQDAGNDQIIITHCVSLYPAPVELANVRAIPALREQLGVLVGWSDHTMSNSAAMAAVALGACYVEKHITLSRALPEGDNAMSIEPQEFSGLVHEIRDVEAALGVPTRQVLEQERHLLEVARRSIYARRMIPAGQRIEPAMLAVRRPRGEISADQFDRVIALRPKLDIAAEEPIRWDQLVD
jgi:N-acetylneuraminate synthase/N,N'-diacetyllegionaminate synthase